MTNPFAGSLPPGCLLFPGGSREDVIFLEGDFSMEIRGGHLVEGSVGNRFRVFCLPLVCFLPRLVS
jgi:hypothetical protein